VAALLRDHPDADGVLAEARQMTEEVIAWTREHDLVPYHDGECLVGPAPEPRRWAMAMMSWAAPGEPEGPSWYHVTPPDASWPAHEQEEWLATFSRTTLPGITVHGVAPGHFSHGRALRHAATEVRQLLVSASFAEGWAHYVEEVAVEEGFRAADPRFAAGVAIEALVRVTRLACSIGLHRLHDRRSGGGPLHRRWLPAGAGGAVGGPPRHVRPRLRPLHLGQARHWRPA